MTDDAHPLAGARVWSARTRRARTLLLSLAATVFMLTLCLSATAGFIADSSVGGIRATLRSAPASQTSVMLRAALAGTGSAEDAKAQDAGVRATIEKTFGGAPVIVGRTATGAGSGTPAATWTITPNPFTVTTADIARLSTGFDHIEAAVTASRAARSPGVRLTGHGGTTALALQRAVGALGAIEPIPITVLVLAGIVALLLARNLLTDNRANETRFLVSRGGSRATIIALDARESAIVTIAGVVVGTVIAQAALLVADGRAPDAASIIVPPTAVFALSMVINVTLSALAARSASGAPRSESGRRRATAPWTLTGFGILVTAIALWRFETAGSDGATFAQDPSAVLAPGALLCAGTLLVLLAAGRLTAGVESGLRRGAAGALFPFRSVNRHIAIVVGPTALLALALAVATLTGSYSGTWSRFSGDSQQLATGGDLRAAVPSDPILSDVSDLIPLTSYTSVAGVSHAAVAIRQSDTFGEVPVTVIGVNPAGLTRLVSASSTVSSPATIARDLDAPSTVGLALPPHAATVTLAARATGTAAGSGSASAVVTLWLADAGGELFPLELHAIAITAPGAPIASAVTAPLPKSGGPWTIEAMDVGVATSSTLSGFEFQLRSLSAAVAGSTIPVVIPSSTRWSPVDAVFDDGHSSTAAAGTIGFGRSAIVGDSVGRVTVRVMPSGAVRVPMVLSRAFANGAGLRPGSPVALDGAFASVTGTVTGVAAIVPGAANGSSLIASLPALDRGWLRESEQPPGANEVWMSSASAAATAARVRAKNPAATLTVAGARGTGDIVRGATTALWIGSAGTAAFAIIALAAAVIALLRRRRVETRALRALGLSAARQASLRGRELGIIAGIAIIVGAVVGVAVSLLVSGTMARLSTPTAPAVLPLRLELDAGPIVVILVALAVAWGCTLAAYRRAILRQAGGRK